MTDVITFDDFQPGATMGHATDVVDERILDLWKQLYPWDTVPAGELAPGLATVLLMRAYMRILTPRPPGNIHARQRMELIAPAKPGEEITTSLQCTGKELKRERRYVEMAARATGIGGRLLFTGRMSLIWAA
jgi:acyl dehydratase